MDNCIDNFLVNYNQGSIERHSDSSDFDETQVAPRLSAKGGKHSLFNKQFESDNKAKKQSTQISCRLSEKKPHMHPNLTIYDNIPEHDHDVTNPKCKKIYKNESTESRGRGDDLLPERFNPKNTDPKPTPCFSSILKRSNNCTKPISTIKDITQDNLNNGKTFCADCERRRIKKLNRCRQTYVVQPVYAVDNIKGGPVSFGHANDRAPLSQHIHKAMRKQDSNTSYELTSSESEIGNKNRKHVSRRRNFIDRFQKEMRKEYIKYEKELIRNRVQQYPSKRDNISPYHVFSTPYCQIINAADASRGSNESNIPSTSSGFWEYLFEKIRGKRQSDKDDRSKPCYCAEEGKCGGPTAPAQTGRCSPEYYEHCEGIQNENILNEPKDFIPECKSCMQQTEDMSKESTTKTPAKKGGPQSGKNAQNIKCKCNSNKKRKKDPSKNSQKSLTQSEDVNKPCQEPHDDITKTIEEKYNGEILCIHNPPCILINGCLNLPVTERPLVQGNLWPVTQNKKSSFYNICRKMKRPKNCEQASQYHPPSIEVQRAMQIKTEKLVQSICNHDPPCEVVYGCYKAKYDPKLANSCVHVPMCERLPQCLIEERLGETKPQGTSQEKLCEHKPKCTEVPLCSRKFVVLTAKGTVGTQVRPKTKLVCRHEPPCIMIPKCLARIIADSYIPFEAIPDCVHQPCCDMIPACCRKAAKEMDKLASVEDGISLKLPRAPVPQRNRIMRAIRRTQKSK